MVWVVNPYDPLDTGTLDEMGALVARGGRVAVIAEYADGSCSTREDAVNGVLAATGASLRLDGSRGTAHAGIVSLTLGADGLLDGVSALTVARSGAADPARGRVLASDPEDGDAIVVAEAVGLVLVPDTNFFVDQLDQGGNLPFTLNVSRR